MNFNHGREITVAMAHRTREALMARRALFAAAGIHATAVVMLLACLAISIHAVFS